MADLTPEGQRIVEDAAQRYSVSADAVRAVLESLVVEQRRRLRRPWLAGHGRAG